jgi:putative oxidoreductase
MRARTTSNRLDVPVAARALSITLWALQLLLAFQFAGGGWLKLSGAPVMVELFDAIGAGQWLRLLVGVLEVAGALGLLIPRLSGLAALGLTALMLGASATNLLILGVDPWLALVLLLLSALVAWGRWPETRRLLGGGAE